MSLRILTILAPHIPKRALEDLINISGVVEHWQSHKEDGQDKEYKFLISGDQLQNLSDKAQALLANKDNWRIIITPVETTIPRHNPDPEEDDNAGKIYGGMTREALYDQIMKGAETTTDFFILVILSTLVTAIGLVTNNLAVIIGAMLIAPLLGPNLAMSFGVTLGDQAMVKQALKANAIGFSLTMFIAVLTGLLLPAESFIASQEFLQRTEVGFGGIVLALASGAAAVLSLTSGVSSTMVGVMVAVALMPPAVAMGVSVGAGLFTESFGAGLLLAMNVICINLATKGVFIFKGIRPRTWYQRKKTQQSLKVSLLYWVTWLIILSIAIYLRHYS